MNTTTREILGVTEVAKIIREDLKAAFPGQKFSVRSSTFAGGSAIDVVWTDGPSYNEVNNVVAHYASRGFDGMIDMSYSFQHARLPNGKIVRVGSHGTTDSGGSHPEWSKKHPGAVPVTLCSSYVQCQRNHSETMLRWALAQMVKQGYILEGDYQIVPGANGHGWSTAPHVRWTLTPETAENIGYTHIANQELNTMLATSFYQRPAPPAENSTATIAATPGATITQERDWVWIKFASKPADNVIEQLRGLGARWSKRRAAWYVTDSSKANQLAQLTQ
jgi:hypothetical protein